MYNYLNVLKVDKKVKDFQMGTIVKPYYENFIHQLSKLLNDIKHLKEEGRVGSQGELNESIFFAKIKMMQCEIDSHHNELISIIKELAKELGIDDSNSVKNILCHIDGERSRCEGLVKEIIGQPSLFGEVNKEETNKNVGYAFQGSS